MVNALNQPVNDLQLTLTKIKHDQQLYPVLSSNCFDVFYQVETNVIKQVPATKVQKPRASRQTPGQQTLANYRKLYNRNIVMYILYMYSYK